MQDAVHINQHQEWLTSGDSGVRTTPEDSLLTLLFFSV